MERKQKHLKTAVILLLVVAAVGSGCHKKNDQPHDTYTCPMHPEIIRSKPGNCPVCGMTLVKKKTQQSASSSARVNYKKTADGSMVILPDRGAKMLDIRGRGVVAIDDGNSSTIAASFAGRIEKLYITSDFQSISKGQRIMDVYSPNVKRDEQDLLFLLRSDPGNSALIGQLEQKLKLIGLSVGELDEIKRTGKSADAVAVRSSVAGIVAERQTPPVRVGDYITRGQPLFSVAGTRSVWVEVEFAPDQLKDIALHDSVVLRPVESHSEIHARIDFLEPLRRNGSNFFKVRIHLDNPAGTYMPGELIDVHLKKTTNGLLWVPSESVLNLGTHAVVFLKSKNNFEPHEVAVMEWGSDWVGISGGLRATDSLALQAHFFSEADELITTGSKGRDY